MPTVSIAMNPTINGLYPIFLMSFKFVDKPIAAIAIVKKIFENNLTISILVIQFELDKYISSPMFLSKIIPTKPRTKYGKILNIE